MQYDVVGQKGSLEVVKQNGYMDCGVECQVVSAHAPENPPPPPPPLLRRAAFRAVSRPGTAQAT
jgi:hypothetical protein